MRKILIILSLLMPLGILASEDKNKKFWEAVNSGDCGKLESVLKSGADINAKNIDGSTALMVAAIRNNIEMANLLLKNGIDTSITDKRGRTALDCAKFSQNNSVHSLISSSSNSLKRKAEEQENEPQAKRQKLNPVIDKSTELSYAVAAGDYDGVLELLENGVDIDSKFPDGDNSLILATRKYFINIINLLIIFGADVNAKNTKDETALHIAVESGYEDIVTLLLKNGANINVNAGLLESGITPLHYALNRGNQKMLKLLIENKANINVKKNYAYGGQSPLHLAVKKGYEDIAQLLLENDVNINAKDGEGETALNLAAKSNDLSMVNLLIRYGANPNADNVKTALGYAKLYSINTLLRNWTPAIYDFYQDKSDNFQLVNFRKDMHKKTNILSVNHKNILNILNKYVASDLAQIILIDYFIGNENNSLFGYWIHTCRSSLVPEYNQLSWVTK